MYSRPMRPAHNYILALACVSFLTITLSGVHAHADVGRHDVTASHEQDLHQAHSHELDHESEHVDVSLFEPARGFSNVETLAPAPTFSERDAPPIVDICWSKAPPAAVPWHHARLRPSLRAPPVSA